MNLKDILHMEFTVQQIHLVYGNYIKNGMMIFNYILNNDER